MDDSNRVTDCTADRLGGLRAVLEPPGLDCEAFVERVADEAPRSTVSLTDSAGTNDLVAGKR